MTDSTPNPKTLDLAALLAGNEHPTETVDVYMNEAIGYAIYKAKAASQKALLLDDKDGAKKAEEELAELVEAGRKARLTVHLQGINKGLKKSIRRKSLSEYPATYDFLGRLVPDDDRDNLHANLMWSHLITRMVGPNGEETGAPTLEEAENFRSQAPESAIDAIEDAVDLLTKGTKAGFEEIAQGHDFL